MNIFRIGPYYIETIKTAAQVINIWDRDKWGEKYAAHPDTRFSWFVDALVRENDAQRWEPPITADISFRLRASH